MQIILVSVMLVAQQVYSSDRLKICSVLNKICSHTRPETEGVNKWPESPGGQYIRNFVD